MFFDDFFVDPAKLLNEQGSSEAPQLYRARVAFEHVSVVVNINITRFDYL